MKFRNHRRLFRYKLQMNRLRVMARYGFKSKAVPWIFVRGAFRV